MAETTRIEQQPQQAEARLYPRRFALRLTVPLVAVLVLLSAVLIALRIEQVLLDFAQGRSLRAAHQMREQIEGGFRLGLSLSDQSNLGDWLQRQRSQDSSMVAARVVSDQGEVAANLGDEGTFGALNPVWTQQLLGQGVYIGAPVASIARSAGVTSFVGVPTSDAAGRRVAVVWLAYDRSALRQSAWSVLAGLWPWAVAAGLGLIGALAWLASAWMRAAHGRLVQAERALAGDAGGAQTGRPIDIVHRVDSALRSRGRAWQEATLLVLAFALTFGVLGALAWKARELARPLLLAQIDESARTVLRLAQGQIDRALSLGIPANGLVGVEAMFDSELQPAQEIAFLALRLEGANAVLFTPRDGVDPALAGAARAWLDGRTDGGQFRVATQPVELQGRPMAQLVTGTSLDYVDQRLRSILIDLLFAVIVSLVLVREALGGLWERSELKPYLEFELAWQGWRARALKLAAQGQVAAVQWLDWLGDARHGVRRLMQAAGRQFDRVCLGATSRELVRIRLLVFLTALSDELLRPFFAVFASEARPLPLALSPTMLAGLPVAAFMLTLALAQPLGPWITRRVEMRRALGLVALVGAVLVAATALTRDSLALVLLRAGSGMCYGLLLILAQTTIVRITDFGQRARGLVEVSAAIVAAGVCGPALGGLLVERLGERAAFGACAACLLGAALAGLSLSALPKDARGELAGSGGWRGLAAVLKNGRVMAVTWFAAVPARLAAAALLVVVTPLYVLELGETAAVSGRVQLLYFLAFMVTAPWVARWSDMGRRRKPWIIGGCVLSALACAALPLAGGIVGMALCCALLGVAQAVLSAPQLAFVTEAFDRDLHTTQAIGGATPEQALAAFRFIERFGSILAPFVVALAVARFGLTGAVGAIGVLLAIGALSVALALHQHRDIGERHAQHA